MSKIAIVYWSGTGNTEAMAEAVAEGVRAAGATASLLTTESFCPDMVASFDAIAFGCPAMGAEVLEEDEFQPLFDRCRPLLSGKPIALFGSYGWGDGEWMRSWEESCQECGAQLRCDSVICQEYPDEEGCQVCRQLGAALI